MLSLRVEGLSSPSGSGDEWESGGGGGGGGGGEQTPTHTRTMLRDRNRGRGGWGGGGVLHVQTQGRAVEEILKLFPAHFCFYPRNSGTILVAWLTSPVLFVIYYRGNLSLFQRKNLFRVTMMMELPLMGRIMYYSTELN